MTPSPISSLGTASLEDAARIGDVVTSVVAQERGSPLDCLATADLPRPFASDQQAAVLERPSDAVGIAQEEGVLEQRLELFRGLSTTIAIHG